MAALSSGLRFTYSVLDGALAGIVGVAEEPGRPDRLVSDRLLSSFRAAAGLKA